MCVTFFCLQPNLGQSSDIQFLIGFNRDQKIQRNTDPLMPFPEDPNIYAGKDQISGGTWLGINIKTGIMVILTNYDLLVQRYGKSRGNLVLSFLKTSTYQNTTIEDYNKCIQSKLCQVLKERQNYSAFNLLVYSIQTQTIFYICSEMQSDEPKILQKNRPFGMCNGPLDQIWQKTQHGINNFENILGNLGQSPSPNDYFVHQMQKVLKDNVSFDKNPQKQASIFINPYYSQNEKAQRMTKCSFVGVVRRIQNSKDQRKQKIKHSKTQQYQTQYQIQMKQITYRSPNLQQSSVSYTKIVGQQQKN